jgi:cytochrome c55X
MVRVAPIVAAAVLAAMTLVAARTGHAADEAVPDTARQRVLITLLHRDCGACHGMRLTGGLGPALTPDALRDRPAAALVATIVDGRRGTAMPPWRPFVSEAEAAWLVARLRAGAVDAR